MNFNYKISSEGSENNNNNPNQPSEWLLGHQNSLEVKKANDRGERDYQKISLNTSLKTNVKWLDPMKHRVTLGPVTLDNP